MSKLRNPQTKTLKETHGKWFYRLNYRFYLLRKFWWRRRIKNKDISIICDDCIGGMLCNDLAIEIQSPFLNGGLSCGDFIRLLQDWDFYMNQPLSFIEDGQYNYPVANIADIKYCFVHYKSNKRAQKLWNIGKKRINLSNAFYIFTEKEGCTYADMKAFDELPFKNKIMLTHKPYPEFKSAFYVKGSEHMDHCRVLSEWEDGQHLGRRYYHQFNWVKWFNNNQPE